MNLDLDFEDRQTGMLIGRAAAMADWSFRRDQRDFAKLVAVLRAKKWAQENPEQRKAIANRYAAKPEARAQALQLAKERRARKPIPVLVCSECAALFIKAGRKGGTVPKFCSTACYSRNRYQRLTPGARRIKRRKQTREMP